jgi:hypothetical protein
MTIANRFASPFKTEVVQREIRRRLLEVRCRPRAWMNPAKDLRITAEPKGAVDPGLFTY